MALPLALFSVADWQDPNPFFLRIALGLGLQLPGCLFEILGLRPHSCILTRSPGVCCASPFSTVEKVLILGEKPKGGAQAISSFPHSTHGSQRGRQDAS